MSELSKRKNWFDRNEQAEQLEAEGKTREALKLYEQNAEEGCDVAYTYERLAALYHADKLYDKEIEALERAIEIEEKRGPTGQMIRLKKRLETTREIKRREERSSPVSRTGEEGTTRRKTVKKKEKKGCLSVLALLLTSGGLLLAAVMLGLQ